LESYRRHLRIFTAIKNRDLNEARKEIREHAQAGKEAVLEQIKQRREMPPLKSYAAGDRRAERS
jgi:DNA-binding GntR family transcriptional regulator